MTNIYIIYVYNIYNHKYNSINFYLIIYHNIYIYTKIIINNKIFYLNQIFDLFKYLLSW